MDPLGLAFENFNAMGMWRDQERGQPIDAAGTLLTGESFTNVTQLKRILATGHALEFYRTLTGKLLTYALGRGLEYYDVAAVDAIVERLAAANGRPSALLAGIIDSAPFQRSRAASAAENSQSSDSRTQRADARPSP
jgi:fructose-1,6-bisphosphatase/inositol monophosphatase family enzyme